MAQSMLGHAAWQVKEQSCESADSRQRRYVRPLHLDIDEDGRGKGTRTSGSLKTSVLKLREEALRPWPSRVLHGWDAFSGCQRAMSGTMWHMCKAGISTGMRLPEKHKAVVDYMSAGIKKHIKTSSRGFAQWNFDATHELCRSSMCAVQMFIVLLFSPEAPRWLLPRPSEDPELECLDFLR